MDEFLEKINRINVMRSLDKEQAKIDKLFEEQGLSDLVLDKQVELNKKRHELNIVDSGELVYKNFVQ